MKSRETNNVFKRHGGEINLSNLCARKNIIFEVVIRSVETLLIAHTYSYFQSTIIQLYFYYITTLLYFYYI